MKRPRPLPLHRRNSLSYRGFAEGLGPQRADDEEDVFHRNEDYFGTKIGFCYEKGKKMKENHETLAVFFLKSL